MNENKVKEIVKDIVDLWNKNDFKSRKFAKGELKLAKWFLPVKTYNWLAEKMGESLLPTVDDLSKTERIEQQDILKEAQKLMGGKIIE